LRKNGVGDLIIDDEGELFLPETAGFDYRLAELAPKYATVPNCEYASVSVTVLFALKLRRK